MLPGTEGRSYEERLRGLEAVFVGEKKVKR